MPFLKPPKPVILRMVRPCAPNPIGRSHALYARNPLCLLTQASPLLTCPVTAMMTNPGAVPRGAAPLIDEFETAEEGKTPEARQRVRKFCRR